MNIYDNDGIALDFATHELAQVSMIRDEKIRRGNVAEITAAALLDIAGSLRIIAAEAAAAMMIPGEVEREGDDEIDDPETEEARDFFVVGDWATSTEEVWDEPGEVVAVGVSEGAAWANLRFSDDFTARVWTTSLVRVPEPVTPPTAADEAEAAGLVPTVELDEEGDVDADFETASALDVLRANEAARKTAKAATKKGTKK